MQKTVYICDGCNKDIGDKQNISANFSNQSGIFTKDKNGTWQNRASIQGKFLHFCGVKCISSYFTNLMNSVKNKK